MTVAFGEVYLHGKTPAQAKALLTACAAVGVDRRSIRATDTGFIVPESVAQELDRAERGWSEREAVF